MSYCFLLLDGVEKIDLFANKIVEHRRGKPKSVTYNSDYLFKHPRISAPVSKIKEVYLKKIPGSNLKEKTKYIIESSNGYSHIQIMPFNYTPNEKTLGYKTSTYFAPDPTLGDLDDIKKMIDDLHSANLGVILDFCIFEFEEFSDNGLFNYDGGRVQASIRNVKIFNRALTPEEIAIEYNTMFNNEVQIHE